MTNRRDFIKQSSAIVAGGLLGGNMFSACGSEQSTQDVQTLIDASFGNPPSAARPGVFWDWLNGNITKAGITRDLEAMQSKGIMRAEIWDVRAVHNTQMIPAGKAFLGDESVALIKHALAEGKRLKMRIGIIASSGWNAGGSWVTPDWATKGLYFSELKVEGGVKISVELPFPNLPEHCPRNDDGSPVFHREVAVFAVPDTEDKHIDSADQIINLTKRFANGRLEWDAPAGKWTVLRFVCSNTGQMLIVPSPNSSGLFIDFFDPEATERYLQYFMDRLGITPANAAESGLAYFMLDSMELEHGIAWTNDMPDVFRKSQGYSIENYLPLLAGWKMNDVHEKVRYDFKQAISDRFIFSHYHTGTEFLKKYKVDLVAEAGGPGPPIWNTCPVDALKALGSVSVPRGEFWIRHRNMFLVKEISSAAHIYGKKIVDAESLTTWRRWKDSPFDVKKYIDRAYGEGLNDVTFVSFAHTTPEEGLPGRTFHAGYDVNPSVTWWEKSKPFFDYISRCNCMLRQGLFVADVCYYYGDQAPNFFPAYHSVPEKPRLKGLDRGYDYDVVNSDVILNRMSVRNGRIVLPDGMSYTLMLLPEQDEMPLSILKKIEKLTAKGATVIGRKPTRMPGFNISDSDQKTFEALTAKLWDSGKITNITPNEALSKLGKGKDFDYSGEHALDYVHRTSDTGEIYFVYNETGQTVKTEVRFRVSDKYPELWDPADGVQTKVSNCIETNGHTHFTLELAPYGSVFVVFNKQKRDLPQTETIGELVRRELTGSWKVRFPEGWGAPQEIVFDELKSWTDSEDPGIKYFSGTAAYSKTFTLDDVAAGKKYRLDLGEVRDLAEVFVNGKSAGILWKKPFCADISGLVRPGENELKVEIVNLWVNRLTGDMLSAPENRYCRTNHPYMKTDIDWASGGEEAYREQPSGLLGPVELLGY